MLHLKMALNRYRTNRAFSFVSGSTRNSDVRSHNVRSCSNNRYGKQNVLDTSYINDTARVRQRTNILGHNRMNITHQQNVSQEIAIGPQNGHGQNNGYANGAKPQNTSNERRNGANIQKKKEALANGNAAKQNGGLERDRQNGVAKQRPIVSVQNVVNRKMSFLKESGNKTYELVPDLRHLLRPTVMEDRREKKKPDYDAEDINGPYNFRQLLRPAEYLPTESLRKRKGGLVVNGAPIIKDRVPGKHVKRRAPLAPSQNKAVGAKAS